MRVLTLGGLILIVLATVIAYWPALQGGMLWDGEAHITKPAMRSWEDLYRILFDVGATQQYYPLLHTAFWIQYLARYTPPWSHPGTTF